MANWGKPDFDARSPEQMQIDREAPHLRERLELEGKLSAWPYNSNVSPGYSPDDVKKHCVNNEEWQQLRLKMKGITTAEKLRLLVDWWNYQRNTAKNKNDQDLWWATEVQVGNYLGALRRGGQLDYANRVRKVI